MACISNQSIPAPFIKSQVSFSNEHGIKLFQVEAVQILSPSKDQTHPPTLY